MARKNFSKKQREVVLKNAEGKSIKCCLCHHRNAVQIHHSTYVCEGGTNEDENLRPMCRKCHVAYHSRQGDFKQWGSKGGQKTAAAMKAFTNLPQFRGEAGQKRLEVYMQKRADQQMGMVA